MSREFLRKLPLFESLSDGDLDRLYAMARRLKLEPGQILVAEGDPGDTAYVAVSGTMEVTKRTGGTERVIDQRRAGDIIGEIALLEDARRQATVRATSEVELIEISRGAFIDLLQRCPSAATSMIQTTFRRVRAIELHLRQSEKMAALGTLSAGLTHELNNPAAAVRRSAAVLKDAIAKLDAASAAISRLDLTPDQMDRIDEARMRLTRRRELSETFDPMVRADSMGELQDWLEELGAEEAWELAAPIVDMEMGLDDVQAMTASFLPHQKLGFCLWLAAACSVDSLLDELHLGAQRISEIVGAVKTYSHLDRASIQLLDVHEGLENTLVILRHKLRLGVSVVREYDRTLPRIEAHGGELNQIWTNLIDNAIDAMNGHGTLCIRTFRLMDLASRDGIAVEITDDGPGISTENQARIFDAFFTTKEPGVGTGLGLHIARGIVADLHGGEMSLRSKPGETTFTVWLPLKQEKRA